MPIQTVRTVLLAASGVTALVGSRVSPVMRDQSETLPCVTLTLASVAPLNHLDGAPTLDANLVQVDSWAETYTQARDVANACRAALEAANVVMNGEFDNYEPEVTEYRVTQEFSVWT